jgi:multiple sugar transport system permease protein
MRSRIIVTALLAVIALYFLLPVYWLVVASTKSTGDLFGTSGLWFGDLRMLENLANVFTYDNGVYLQWTINSVLYAFVGATLSTLIAAAAGYSLAKFSFRGRETVFNLVLGGVLVPATALALPLYLMLSEVDLANTYWAVLLHSLVNPFGVYLLRIYAEAAVPDDLLEAGRIDGASEARIFFSVVLKILTPGLVTVFLFQFVGIWNNFFLPLVMLTDPDLFPMSLGLYHWSNRAIQFPQYTPLVIVGSLLAVVPLVLAFVVLQRQWRSGLAIGSVK